MIILFLYFPDISTMGLQSIGVLIVLVTRLVLTGAQYGYGKYPISYNHEYGTV